MKAAFPVDISLLDVSDALWQGDQIDWDSLTVGEALALLGHGGSMIVSVSGSDLIDWRKSVTEKAEGKSFDLSWTGLEYSAVTPDQTYHVLAGWEVASQLEPEDQSFRDIRFVPALEYDALAERFRRSYLGKLFLPPSIGRIVRDDREACCACNAPGPTGRSGNADGKHEGSADPMTAEPRFVLLTRR